MMGILSIRVYLATLTGFGICAGLVYAHEGHHHLKTTEPSAEKSQDREAKLQAIGTAYFSRVKPIFEKSCFDCHSSQTRFPIYYRIPGIKQLIDSDIQEAKEHLDFSGGFPFKGHGSPEEDLEAISKVTRDRSMPPFLYRIFHRSQKLTDEDRETILQWIQESLKRLE